MSRGTRPRPQKVGSRHILVAVAFLASPVLTLTQTDEIRMHDAYIVGAGKFQNQHATCNGFRIRDPFVNPIVDTSCIRRVKVLAYILPERGPVQPRNMRTWDSFSVSIL